MLPDTRAALRFFDGVPEACPVSRLSHLYLAHWPVEETSPLPAWLEAGFQGVVVAGRVSIARALRQDHPHLNVRLDDRPTAGQKASRVLMELPQGRRCGLLAIADALAATAADPAGGVWVFGTKELGIQTAAKYFTPSATALSRGHMRLFYLPSQAVWQDPLGRFADPLTGAGRPCKVMHEPAANDLGRAADSGSTLQGQDEAGIYELTACGLRLATLPGVFSWEEADPGSELLLDTLLSTAMNPGAGAVRSEILDWGCGNGLLGVALARHWPESLVVMSDDQWSAVRCARISARWNGVENRCLVLAEDGIGDQLLGRRFHLIVSNPPLHRGVRTDHTTLKRFLPAAWSLLLPGGQLWMVSSNHMDLAKLAAPLGAKAEAINQRDHFTVWRFTSGVEVAPVTRHKPAKSHSRQT